MLRIAKYKYDPVDRDTYVLIKQRVNRYFEKRNKSRFADTFMVAKTIFLFALAIAIYLLALNTANAVVFLISMGLFLFINLIIGMTVGHDAAHASVTGNRYWDNIIHRSCFVLNGIYPGTWKEKHNKSHHAFPNVHDYDSDLEVSRFIFLSQSQKKWRIHRYQHLYAPFLYMFFTLGWLFYFDFVYNLKKNQGNLSVQPKWYKIFMIVPVKLLHLGLFIVIPAIVGHLSLSWIILSFLGIHMLASLFLSFTFFMSHHVLETHYQETESPNHINQSWLQHQLNTTVDFHGESKIANLIFGGFHAHIAHHLFPNICHVHYPNVTRIIRSILEERDLRYQSIQFHKGVFSHLQLLKLQGSS